MWMDEDDYFEVLESIDNLNAQVLAITKAQEAAAKEASDKEER